MPLSLYTVMSLYMSTRISYLEWGREIYDRALNILLQKGGIRKPKRKEFIDRLCNDTVGRLYRN
ncbi:MAG: hypothetical protein J7K23_09205 [Thermoproteales archaeon]|nr:hypothetical protein [Thermoproteales archaeon]